jgi:hypothetical protein
MATGSLRRYKVKSEYKTLFSNLATGAPLTARDALRDHGGPSRKSYSEDEIRDRVFEKEAATLERLVKAGFIEAVDEPVEYKERGE